MRVAVTDASWGALADRMMAWMGLAAATGSAAGPGRCWGKSGRDVLFDQTCKVREGQKSRVILSLFFFGVCWETLYF